MEQWHGLTWAHGLAERGWVAVSCIAGKREEGIGRMGEIRLLIAETDPVTRTIIRKAASEEGFALDEAVDGITAIKLFRRNEYPLIMLNMSLPELDGRNVLIQMRKLSDVPIFILCDQPTNENCLTGYKLGADEFIRKPFHAPELMARIKVFLHRSGATKVVPQRRVSVSYTHLRAHETRHDLVCR